MQPLTFTFLAAFCGIGPGALGFLRAAVRLLGTEGRFVCLGGIDVDPPRRRLRTAQFHRIEPSDRERIVDNGMQVASRGVCYHGYTTRIGFLIGVVQAPRFRYSRKQHSATSTRTCSRRALVYQPITAGRESKTVTP